MGATRMLGGGKTLWTEKGYPDVQAGLPSNDNAPNAPTFLEHGTLTTTSVPLTWGAATVPNPTYPVQGYVVLRNGVQVVSTGATTLTYTDTGEPGGVYLYSVQAYNAKGNSPASTLRIDLPDQTDITVFRKAV